MLSAEIRTNFRKILEEELVLATGCTEPIAIAYCAAQMRKLLGSEPEYVNIAVSGNILKNVKSVVVPNTAGRRGIGPAAAVGIIAGDPDAGLQVIAEVSEQQQGAITSFIERVPISVTTVQSPCLLDIAVTGLYDEHTATVRITNHHTNIIYKELDGRILLDLPVKASAEDNLADKSTLTVRRILEYASTVSGAEFDAIKPLLERQIRYNSAIAQEGIDHEWGAQIGRILLAGYGDKTKDEARAYAAAGSDARMSGCEMPVVILSGSGNQGITASVPVVRYAGHLDVTRDDLYRALIVSDLVTIEQKFGIGRLSAYCGAISAGVGAGAGIAYLDTRYRYLQEHGNAAQSAAQPDTSASCASAVQPDTSAPCASAAQPDTLEEALYRAVAHTVVNSVAVLSGTICDGAKPSCAAKIASAVDAGIMGYEMYEHNKEFHRGEGIVSDSVDETLKNVGRLASEGMQETDVTIQHIMCDY